MQLLTIEMEEGREGEMDRYMDSENNLWKIDRQKRQFTKFWIRFQFRIGALVPPERSTS